MTEPIYTLASLRRAVEALPAGSSVTLPREALLQALNGNGDAPASSVSDPPDRLLTVREVAARMGVSVKYVYGADLPFARRVGKKALRFSERGLEKWLARSK